MASNSKTRPSARKVLIENDNSSISQIPSELLKGFGENVPSVAWLRIDRSGKAWRLAVEKFKGEYFFTDGWKAFAEAVDLKSWDYLQIKTVGLPEEEVTGDHTESSGGRKQQLTKELKTRHAYRMEIPKDVAMFTGIPTNRDVEVEDVNGKKWPVRVTGSVGDRSLTRGWNDFLKGNKVVIGSTFSFEFVSSSEILIKARMIKEGGNKKHLFEFVKANSGKTEKMAELDEKNRAYEKAEAFQAKIPPEIISFVSLMNPSSTSHKYQLNIPIDIVRKISLESPSDIEVGVKGHGDGVWRAKFNLMGRTSRLTSGWKGDNEVKAEDACVFEVNNSKNKLVWNVTIFKN